MEPMQTNDTSDQDPQQPTAWETGTISDALDRLDSLIGRIGMNSREQALAILIGLDAASARMQERQSRSSQKTLQVQFDALIARLQKEAGSFLRDLGGRSMLHELRAAQRPPAENHWWYLDDWLAQRRQVSFKHNLSTLGAIVLGMVLLAVIYQRFLAPDPDVLARMGHEDSASEALVSGDLETALSEVEQGLSYDLRDLDLLILKGVVLQASGKLEEAQTAFDQAALAAESRDVFLLSRGQTYIMVGMLDAALTDTQSVLTENPQSAPAHLLTGQIYELRQDYLRALEYYEKAGNLADAQNQPELTAVARTRMAYLAQIMSAPQWPTLTETP